MSDHNLIRIISDCISRSDGVDPDNRGTLVYDETGRLVSSREWYDACAGILIKRLMEHGYRIERGAA